jgi:OmcA/MtrC family decaheme c-type cytochrome
MIHRIHTGEDLTKLTPDFDCTASTGDPNAFGCFTIYGFGGSINNFNEVRFPGDRRDCQTCHTTVNGVGTEQVSETPPPGLLATQTPRDWYTPMHHNTAACLGCHDSQAAAAHAFTMTAPFGEACAACHGPDAEFSVDKVHAH